MTPIAPGVDHGCHMERYRADLVEIGLAARAMSLQERDEISARCMQFSMALRVKFLPRWAEVTSVSSQ